MKVRISDAAEADIRAVHAWYKSQSPGLEKEFRGALAGCLDRISREPLPYAEIRDSIRRAFVKRFPYGVFYVVEASEIVVLGVLHGRRDPSIWERRGGA